jgi:hypothetical protein
MIRLCLKLYANWQIEMGVGYTKLLYQSGKGQDKKKLDTLQLHSFVAQHTAHVSVTNYILQETHTFVVSYRQLYPPVASSGFKKMSRGGIDTTKTSSCTISLFFFFLSFFVSKNSRK